MLCTINEMAIFACLGILHQKFNFDATLLYSDDTWAMVQFENIKLAFVVKTQHPPHIAFEVERFEETDRTKKHRDGSVSVYKNDPWKNIYELIKYESEE